MMNFFKTLVLCGLLSVSTLASASAVTIEMDVSGLVCAFCAQGIEKSLKVFPATQEVFVSLEHHLVALATKEGADVDDAQLTKAITDAGYTVLSIRRTHESLDAVRRRVGGDE